MTKSILRRLCGIVGIMALLIAANGCGSGLVKVNGKVLKDGKPLTGNGRTLQVIFHAIEAGDAKPGEAFIGNRSIDGTFKVPGRAGKGIPPGKYRVSVELMSSTDHDQLQGAFSPQKTPLTRDVNSSAEMVIDLDTPAG